MQNVDHTTKWTTHTIRVQDSGSKKVLGRDTVCKQRRDSGLEYEELGDREEFAGRTDHLEGHLVTIARFNYALQPHGWAILPFYPGGEEYRDSGV